MKIEMNINKKHLYIISGLIAVFALTVFVTAIYDRNPGHTYDQVDLGPISIDSETGPVTIRSSTSVIGDLNVVGNLGASSQITAPAIVATALGKIVLPFHQGEDLDPDGGNCCNPDQEGAIMYNQPDHNFYGCKYSEDNWCCPGEGLYCWDNLN